MAAAIGGSATTYAVAALADSNELEEVIVTAQKRAQDLQSVPISIQVLTGAKLGELQTRSFADYVQYLPSVNYTTGSTGLPGNSSAR